MAIGYKEAINEITNAAMGNPSISLDNKKQLMILSEKIIEWISSFENEAVQPSTEDVPEPEE